MTVAASHPNKQTHECKFNDFTHLELKLYPGLTVKAMFLSKSCISQLVIENPIQWYITRPWNMRYN